MKAGSLDEADDQLGLAHLIEHMAFNGSAHFKPGELVSYFESIGARLGPHVNAYTSFDETVYMFDVPTDKPEVVEKALTALADFAGGLSLTPQEVDKERGVVIEEWRGGLGAGSRIRDKQFPVLFHQSRYAERLPIGKPEILRNAPAGAAARVLRHLVSARADGGRRRRRLRSRSRWSRRSRRPSRRSPRARPKAAEPDRKVPLHQQPLVSVVADPEVTQSSVSILRKRQREGEQRVADYRRDLVARTIDHMMDERFGELERKPDAKFLGAGVSGGGLSRDVVDLHDERAACRTASSRTASASLATEALRVREFGFSASELDRAKKWMAAFYERAYSERDKTESGSFAQEYLNYFLEGEPSPGIEYEYRLVKQLLPTITEADASTMARSLLGDDSRVILATSPQKAGIKVPTEAELQAALTAATSTRGHAVDRHDDRRAR